MTEWFSGLSSFQQTYWIITGISTLIFLFILIGTFIGAEGDDIGDVDVEIEADTGAGFQFFTFKNLVAFFALFGWSGIASIDVGNFKSNYHFNFYCLWSANDVCNGGHVLLHQ